MRQDEKAQLLQEIGKKIQQFCRIDGWKISDQEIKHLEEPAVYMTRDRGAFIEFYIKDLFKPKKGGKNG